MILYFFIVYKDLNHEYEICLSQCFFLSVRISLRSAVSGVTGAIAMLVGPFFTCWALHM